MSATLLVAERAVAVAAALTVVFLVVLAMRSVGGRALVAAGVLLAAVTVAASVAGSPAAAGTSCSTPPYRPGVHCPVPPRYTPRPHPVPTVPPATRGPIHDPRIGGPR